MAGFAPSINGRFSAVHRGDYRRNFNKREARYARKLAGFVVRRRLTADEIATWRTNWPPPRKVLYWLLANEWKGQLAIDIVKSFEARA